MGHPSNPKEDGATRANPVRAGPIRRPALKIWIPTFHYSLRVEWSHTVFSLLHLFRWSQQVVGSGGHSVGSIRCIGKPVY